MLATTGLKNHENISQMIKKVLLKKIRQNESLKKKKKLEADCTLYAIINHGNEMELTQACKVYN